MPRKLTWDKGLGINSDSGIKKVVRDLVGRDSKEITEEIIQETKENNINAQFFENKVVNDINLLTNSVKNKVNNQLINKVNNVLINDDINISIISSDNKVIDIITDKLKMQSDNLLDNQPGLPVNNSAPKTTNINTKDVQEELSATITTDSTERLPKNSKRKTEKLLAKIIKTKEPSKRVISSLIAMGQWHTESEQKVYEVMYGETIAHRRKDRYFTSQDLCEKTGIASQTTVRTAIDGLVEKKSLDILARKGGGRLAIRYRVYSPTEIVVRRREAKIKIDEQSKQIL